MRSLTAVKTASSLFLPALKGRGFQALSYLLELLHRLIDSRVLFD
jgi:hypothetical protein